MKEINKKTRKNIKESLKLTTLAFTLVELLAVIVILAIILVIAVPKVMEVINDSKKATLESTVKMIASTAEKAKIQNAILGKDDEIITCESITNINDVDYANCYIRFDENIAKVTIAGSGKFEGLYVCNGTKTETSAIEDECTANTLVTHIQSLYANESTRISNGLTKDNTSDENIRYAGANNAVKNYVEFGNTNELWRIIGIFEVETADGKTEELVKIIREDSIGNVVWDSSASNVNKGYGINQWGEIKDAEGNITYEGADVMRLLNGYYIGIENSTCTYCNGFKQEICTNNCSGTVTQINGTYKNMIENVVWNTGAINVGDPLILNPDTAVLNPVNWYNAERGIVTGKICTSGDDCNDAVTRTTTWEGLVALPYATDWGYASSESGCRNNLKDGVVNSDYTNGTCKKNNWMHYGTTSAMEEITWTLSSWAHSASEVVLVDGLGSAFVAGYGRFRVRPTLYLKSNVQIKDGDGSSGNAYKLS